MVLSGKKGKLQEDLSVGGRTLVVFTVTTGNVAERGRVERRAKIWWCTEDGILMREKRGIEIS